MTDAEFLPVSEALAALYRTMFGHLPRRLQLFPLEKVEAENAELRLRNPGVPQN